MIKPRFVHLRVHSDYSIIDGLAKTEILVEKTAEIGMPALAITDFTNLCGLIKFYEIAHYKGIKPIIGADFHVRSEVFTNEMTQITILAMNNTGYHNLILLISRAYQQGYGIHGPWINREWLSELNEGILLISGGRMGDIGKSLLLDSKVQLKKCLIFYEKYFSDRFYLELIRTGRPNEENYLHAAVMLAEKYKLPVVATNDTRFINKDDFDVHEIRVAIHDGFTLDDPNRPHNYSPQQYMRSEDEMCELFSDIPEALENSVEIAKRCNVTITLGKYFLPKFPTGDMTTEDFLIMKSQEGLEERLLFLFPDKEKRKNCRSKYDKRLNLELRIINQMGFPGYFLIVMEFIRWSKDHGVPVGPGRGSCAGSLVSYALKITELDPLEFDLLFERFLNPERISMPDFDIDFCMEKRDQVIEHVTNMYGRDAVSQIITFGTMAAKAVIRDVGRVLGYPYSFVDRIAKLIPSDYGMTLEKAFEIESQLLKFYKADEKIKSLIDIARKLEGVIRNAGKHAGGIVIAPTTITDFSPLYCDETGQHPVTQFDKNDVEYVGLVKFDFLGLRTLTIINHSLRMINKQREKNNELPLDITAIPLDDKKSFEILQRSETTAVFQLESRGMKDLIKRLQPDCFEDMIALVALFRPGPLQSGMVDNFINRKHGLEEISYPDVQWQHKSLQSVLEPTYGIILYQEQVMQIAQVLSGYTLGSADILRRAMGKKKQEEMAKQRFVFEYGARKNGINSKLAMKIFDLVEKFAGYGFNKSHSAAYALISYQTLWLKTHYPAEFMAAAMSIDMDNTEKIVGLIDECRRMGVTILPPDINYSMYYFHVNENKEIVYGIGAIKGVGETSAKEIIKSRKNGGYFRNLFDFCTRIDTKKVNRRVLEKIIMSGAFDKLGTNRSSLMNSLADMLKAADQYSKAKAIGQIDMFNTLSKEPEKKYDNYSPWTEKIILNGEKETLGLYLTSHPINQYLKEIEHYIGSYRLKDLRSTEPGKIITVAGFLISKKIMINKKGNHIGVCTLDDHSDMLDVVLLSDILNKYQKLLRKDRILIVSGQVSFNDWNNHLKIIAREVIDIDEIRKKCIRGLIISLNKRQINYQLLRRLRQSIEPYCPGNIPVYLHYQREDACAKLRFGKMWNIIPNDRLLNNLRNLVGSGQVELKFD